MFHSRIVNHWNRARLVTLVVLSIVLLTGLFGSPYVVRATNPFVQIVKTGPDTANPGDHIVFELAVTTYASGVATDVVVWDDLYYASLDRYEIFRRELTPDELATLNAGGAVVIQVPYQVPCDAGGHVLDNDAYVEATFADGTTHSATNDHDVTVPRPDEVVCTPAIDLEKLVNGQDADTMMEAVVVMEGDPLTFEYIVTNSGDAAFYDVVVMDDNETPGDVTDDITIGTIHSLAPGQSVTFVREAVAEAGLHTDVGTVCGRPSTSSGCEPPVCDDDAANYFTAHGPGAGTPGYWMNHPEAWPVEEIIIGGLTYTKQEAINYMWMPVKGDKTFTMFPALVAAKLNVLIGNDSWCIADTITAADAWMANYVLGSGVHAGGKNSPWREGEPLYEMLDAYNNGDLPCAVSRDYFD